MERSRERLDLARKAHARFAAIAGADLSDEVLRDAAIQRFEYTLEAVWRLAQRVLRIQEGVEVASPKAVVRASHGAKWLDEHHARLALQMVDHRNLSSHTYNEGLAEQIAAHIPAYLQLLQGWIEAIAARLDASS